MSQAQEIAAPKRPIPELRDFARVQVAEVGLRPAARLSGITPTGLRLFVNETHPRDHIRRKLVVGAPTPRALGVPPVPAR